MMKKLSLLFALMLSTLMVSAQTLIDGIYYNLTPQGKVAEVTYKYNAKYTGSVTIPANVTYEGITYSVRSIGKNAFSRCYDLESVTIGNNVVSIGEEAFFNCYKLSSVTIPNSVTSIGNYAFRECSSLISVRIPYSVTSIGQGTFYMCSKLTSITIPNSVTSIGAIAFGSCRALTYISIPNSVTSIGQAAFESCPITSFTIPYGVTSIEKNTFQYCSKLKSISIPNSVTSIGESAFIWCSDLTSITIPNSVTSIEKDAFSNCIGLTSLKIPNGVKSIGEGAFNGCTGLTSVTLSNSVTSLEKRSFCGCTGLTLVAIPNSVTSIGENAFNACTGLKSVIILNSATSIGDYAFSSCSGLTDVYCYAERVPLTGSDVFKDSYVEYGTLHVPYVSVAAYKAVEPWNVFGRIETIGDVPITEKCATPIIDYENGDISFFCETKGVEFVYNFSTPSESDEDGKGINMPNKLQVSVYAKKDGFENSDVATKEIDLGTSGIRGDLNGDGVVNMPDAMFIVNKILKGEFPDETPDIKPIDLTAYIQLPSSFIPYLSNSDELAAFCGDENRGTGTLIDGVWCIRIRGNVGDKITLRYYCATNRLIYNSTETIELKGDVYLGTFDVPRIIDFNLDNSTR